MRKGLIKNKYPYIEMDDKYVIYTYYHNKLIYVEKDKFDENEIEKAIIENGLDVEIKKCAGEYSNCVELIICLTNACNLRCKYCFIGEEGTSFKYISEENIDKAIEKVRDLARIQNKEKVVIQFFGGEPTLCRNLMEYAIMQAKNILKDYIVEFGITTNGVFDTDIADFLIENNFVIAISMDGLPKFQDEQRVFANGNGTSAYLERTIKYLVSKKYNPTIRITITKYMVPHFRKIIDYLGDLGVKIIHFEPVTLGGRANSGETIYRPDPLELCDALKDSIEYAREKDICILTSSLMKAASPCETFCDAVGKNKIAVTYEGLVTSCLGIQSIEHPLSELFIMNTDDVKKWIDESYHSNISDSEKVECKNCFAKYVCAGGCPSRNFYANKSTEIVDDMHCITTKTMFEYYITDILVNQ